MDQRTRQCVRRMKVGDIASLSEAAYCRARHAFDSTRSEDRNSLNVIHNLRMLWIREGMDPNKGQRWFG